MCEVQHLPHPVIRLMYTVTKDGLLTAKLRYRRQLEQQHLYTDREPPGKSGAGSICFKR